MLLPLAAVGRAVSVDRALESEEARTDPLPHAARISRPSKRQTVGIIPRDPGDLSVAQGHKTAATSAMPPVAMIQEQVSRSQGRKGLIQESGTTRGGLPLRLLRSEYLFHPPALSRPLDIHLVGGRRFNR